jgi:hypothetical protein
VENEQLTLKVIIAYDNQDAILGDYFTACKDDILGFLKEQQTEGFPLEIVVILDSSKCNAAYIDLKLAAYQNQPLLFIAYSHGLIHSLLCNHQAYLDKDNLKLLFHSFLYTNACSSASGLGTMFQDQQGCFIGFDKEVKAFKESEMRKISINCDNCGIKHSIGKPETPISETYKAMKNYYSNQIDKLDDIGGDFLLMEELRNSRDALKLYGNKNLTMKAYINRVIDSNKK